MGTATNPTAGDYGFKVAQAGIDVDNASDYQLLFNSAWPSLAVAFEKTVVIPSGGLGSGVGTIAHNLKFVPFTMAWVIEGGIVTRRTFPNVDATNAYINDIYATGDITVNIVCYNLDITKPQEQKFFAPPGASTVYNVDYGFKVVKPNKKSDSRDLRDYIVHTRAQSPAVLAIKTAFDAGTNNITYTNAQGYTPWVFGYGLQPGATSWTFANPYNQSVPGIFITGNAFQLQLDVNWQGSMIVLRDPLFAANSVQVTY